MAISFHAYLIDIGVELTIFFFTATRLISGLSAGMMSPLLLVTFLPPFFYLIGYRGSKGKDREG